MSGQVGQQQATLGGRYKVERLIARGGMGSVYLCQDTELPRRLALKVLEARSTGDGQERFEDRFRLEASTLAGLNHPNIVTLYDFGRMEDGRFFLALEYIDGPRFTDLIRTGPMPVDRAVRLLSQVCRALRYAHRRGVVHRDLKPSNLLVRVDEDGEEQVKVVDFGLVKVVDDQSITRAGLILGSPHCMAPEQVRGTEVDHRADIYALGVLLFRAVSGQWPFHGESSTSTMIAHVQQAVPRLASVAPDLLFPEGLESILQRCLEKSPERRYPDAGALLDAFRVLGGVRDSFSGTETGSFSGVSLTGEGPPMVALASLPPVPSAQQSANWGAAPGVPRANGHNPGPAMAIAEPPPPQPNPQGNTPGENAATREEISSAVSMAPRDDQRLPMWIFAAGAGVGLGLVGLALSLAIWWNTGSGEVQVVAPEAMQATGAPSVDADPGGGKEGTEQLGEGQEEGPPAPTTSKQKAAPAQKPAPVTKPTTPAANKPTPAKATNGGTAGSSGTTTETAPPTPSEGSPTKEQPPSEASKGDDKYLGTEAWPE